MVVFICFNGCVHTLMCYGACLQAQTYSQHSHVVWLGVRITICIPCGVYCGACVWLRGVCVCVLTCVVSCSYIMVCMIHVCCRPLGVWLGLSVDGMSYTFLSIYRLPNLIVHHLIPQHTHTNPLVAKRTPPTPPN